MLGEYLAHLLLPLRPCCPFLLCLWHGSRGVEVAHLAANGVHSMDERGADDLNFRRERLIVRPAAQIRVGRVLVIVITAPLLDVREKGGDLIEVLRGEWIELVIVAFATTKGRPQPGGAH